ncbi:hypothetical protein ACNKHU_24190 [Shigella flexneri]
MGIDTVHHAQAVMTGFPQHAEQITAMPSTRCLMRPPARSTASVPAS